MKEADVFVICMSLLILCCLIMWSAKFQKENNIEVLTKLKNCDIIREKEKCDD